MTRFADRSDAGRQLAQALQRLDLPDPVVLALPRGGVPVAVEVARELKAPLDLVMVRKIGAPGQPELAVAAIVNGDDPQLVINADVARFHGLTAATIAEMAKPRLDEIARRRGIYLRGRASVPLAGRTAVVVDDGIATGASIRASLKAVRQRGPARLVLAVPTAPAEVAESLRQEVDDLVVLDTPSPFHAVGAQYQDFSQTEDADVLRLMDEVAALSGAVRDQPGASAQR